MPVLDPRVLQALMTKFGTQIDLEADPEVLSRILEQMKAWEGNPLLKAASDIRAEYDRDYNRGYDRVDYDRNYDRYDREMSPSAVEEEIREEVLKEMQPEVERRLKERFRSRRPNSEPAEGEAKQ